MTSDMEMFLWFAGMLAVLLLAIRLAANSEENDE